MDWNNDGPLGVQGLPVLSLLIKCCAGHGHRDDRSLDTDGRSPLSEELHVFLYGYVSVRTVLVL